MYLAHETAFIIGGIIIIIVIHQCNEAADWVCMQAEEDEQRLSEAQQAAEDEAALRAMREEGMLSDQPNSSPPSSLKVLWVEPTGRLRPHLRFSVHTIA